MVTRSNPS